MNLTVCLACCNGEKYIKEQIESILPQLVDGDELIVGDDGSTDGTLEIVKRYSDRITRILESRVGGVNKNFERLVQSSANQGVVLSDQDDVWLPDRLGLIRQALRTSSLVVTNGYVVDRNLAKLNKTVFQFVGFRRGLVRNFIKNSYVGCCMAFRRDLVVGALPFDRHMHAHDWLIGLLGEIDGRVCVINQPTLLYRRHSRNLSQTGLTSKNSFPEKIRIRYHMLRNLIILLTLRTNN
jgi:glycosyltransferase involved in cell wall biosynthesis